MKKFGKEIETYLFDEYVVLGLHKDWIKVLGEIPKEVIKTLEDEGKKLNHSMKVFNKPIKRGRPPLLRQEVN